MQWHGQYIRLYNPKRAYWRIEHTVNVCAVVCTLMFFTNVTESQLSENGSVFHLKPPNVKFTLTLTFTHASMFARISYLDMSLRTIANKPYRIFSICYKWCTDVRIGCVEFSNFWSTLQKWTEIGAILIDVWHVAWLVALFLHLFGFIGHAKKKIYLPFVDFMQFP